MNEKSIILPNTDSDKVVIVGQNEKKFEVKKWEIKNPHKGHTLWEISLDTGDIKPAVYAQVDMELARLGPEANLQTVRKKVITKPNCIYISALNISNAAKKFAKRCKEGGLIK